MPNFSVHMTETRHFIIPVSALTVAKAKEKARAMWRDAPTTGQWEISDTEEEIVSVMEAPE